MESLVTGLILVVDDDPAIRMMLRMMLQLDGFTIHEAEDGIDALNLISAHPPDLLILDVMMPRMDGITLCKTLRGRKETAVFPIIMLSGKVQPEAEREGLAAGANRYLHKPTPRHILSREVASLLEEQSYAKT
jgi:CheY-like chemotaxis protein